MPACANSAARTPACVGIALWMRFTEPPVLVYSISPAEWLPAIARAFSVVSSSKPSSTAPADAAPNGPTPTGG